MALESQAKLAETASASPTDQALVCVEEFALNDNAEQSRSLTTTDKQGVRGMLSTSAPFVVALGVFGVTLIGGVVKGLLGRGRKKQVTARAQAVSTPQPAVDVAVTSSAACQPATTPVDLSPFGSPVGSTPVRLPPAQRSDKLRLAARAAASDVCSDADDQSDNASVRDQRQALVDASQLQKTLKQMQEMAEENRKLSVFLAEYKADAEKLSKLEEENRALRDVTRQLEVELQELKTNTMPRTGAELEIFKNSVRVPSVARSVCSNDDTIGLGVSTASVDAAIPDARVRRNNVFKQLLATLQGTTSTGNSQPATPRGASAGGAGSVEGANGSSRQRKTPRPEDAAMIGQAVYQLLDQFGGRMI